MVRKPRATTPSQPHEPPIRIALKLKYRSASPPQELRGLRTFLEQVGHKGAAPRLVPLVESLDAGKIAELVGRARHNDPTYQAAEFSTWFQIVPPVDVNAEDMLKAIRELGDVESAYLMRPVPPPVNPANDPRNVNQGYEDAAANGIDVRYAWGFAGGDGAGIGFVDMERGWNLNHEDLAAAGITLISGISNDFFFHGTSVLGEVLMVDNTVGGVGIAPSATGRVVSQWRTAANYNTVDAILDAVAHMAFGDVLLLEAQDVDPVSGQGLWPVEIADATYEAIRLATALGIVVVEAGSNGSNDLDVYTNASGKQIFNRGSTDFRDSGAIMVGAGSSAAPHTRLGFSNHGSRIDCYAWGESVDTTSTNSAGTDNTLYTSGFNGTSSASPIVAGAAVVVQGLAQASLGYRFSPRELRTILTTNGTPSADPANDRIGVMPDLHAIITNNQLNLAPDLYLRDYVGDAGNPTSGTVSQSPDIIVRQAATANPQGAYGAGSGTENDVTLSQDIDTGHDNYIYVRLLNRGGSVATSVAVDVFWSPPATLVTPNMWHKIDTTTIPSVPVSNVLTVSDAIVWHSADIPAPGHYCFVAVAGNAQDPKPDPTTFTSFDQYVAFVENNNNVAWRNFNVVPGPPSPSPPPGAYKLDFLIPGAFDTGHVFDLEAMGWLPEKSRVFLEVPAWLADALRPHPCEVKTDEKHVTTRIALHPTGVRRLGSAMLHARAVAKCRLLVQIPQQQRHHRYEFAVRQIYKGREVGRLAWVFPALGKKDEPKKEAAQSV
jgi:serine protease